MLCQMCEYQFEDGDLVTEIFSQESIDNIRDKLANMCTVAAEDIVGNLTHSGCLASMITFVNGNSFNLMKIKGLDNDIVICTHHSVVLLGDCIMDLLYSDKLVRTKDYIASLKLLNPELCIKSTMSGNWYGNEGYPIPITMELLENLG